MTHTWFSFVFAGTKARAFGDIVCDGDAIILLSSDTRVYLHCFNGLRDGAQSVAAPLSISHVELDMFESRHIRHTASCYPVCGGSDSALMGGVIVWSLRRYRSTVCLCTCS
jgi:hypothetical protein